MAAALVLQTNNNNNSLLLLQVAAPIDTLAVFATYSRSLQPGIGLIARLPKVSAATQAGDTQTR